MKTFCCKCRKEVQAVVPSDLQLQNERHRNVLHRYTEMLATGALIICDECVSAQVDQMWKRYRV